MIEDKLKELERKANEIRFKIKKIAMDINFNGERMKARELHNNAMMIASMTFKLHIAEDQISRINHSIALRELSGEGREE